MSRQDDELDVELADHGDDRPGIDDLEGDDYSALLGDLDDSDADDDLDDEDLDDDADEDDDDDEDEDDYPDDATEEDIDLVVAMYREDGKPAASALSLDLANDLDELIKQLRRVPGEAGALGAVSITGDFFVLVRVRGRKIQVLLSDAVAANDWPIARDVADFLGAEIPEDDDDSGPIGDLDMFADAGVSELELEALGNDLDSDSDEIVEKVAKRLGFGAAYAKVAATFDL
ncbi:tRNA adenosine deaminase-associated protein [Nigerium massiliense]|uniref:tRNA adenosine deaminase-associated protein n=1 Tax=Nigerium massiliense TaxID=1522317 RepID=UPI0005901C05|nr:tRNA adenosine deaminase-associated protein [Nigerium massiliense]